MCCSCSDCPDSFITRVHEPHMSGTKSYVKVMGHLQKNYAFMSQHFVKEKQRICSCCVNENGANVKKIKLFKQKHSVALRTILHEHSSSLIIINLNSCKVGFNEEGNV